MSNIDSLLSLSAPDVYSRPLRESLWLALDAEVSLADCAIFSYRPDLASDPFGEDGALWSFNYFFYNRGLRRLVLFTCRAASPFSQAAYDGEMMRDVAEDVDEVTRDLIV